MFWGLAFSLLFSAPQAIAEAVCAQVQIEIQQELTLERQAFDAKMRINNGLDTLAIEDVSVTVNFQDENGNGVLATNDPDAVGAAFYIDVSSLDNISDVNGSGVVAPGTSAEIHWLIIPSSGAAEDIPTGKLFFVGAHLSYTLGGEPESVDVTPDFITVKPLPRLVLDYFLTRDVVGDDPFTTPVEPPVPYTLGVRVKNDGVVAAKNLTIDSAQPKIIKNEQELLINFEILSSSVDNLPAAPVLLIDFGDIAGGGSKVGRWDMISTLSGEFVDFDATFTHADELGGAVTSLIQEPINTHRLQHNVRVDLSGRDNVRDFLAKDDGVYRVYESEGVDSDVVDLSTDASLTSISSGADYTDYQLAFTSGSPFSFVRLSDPHGGSYELRSVTRSDGKTISLDNAWLSQTRNRETHVPDKHFNLFDANTTGEYIVRLGVKQVGPQPPTMQFVPDRETFEGNSIGFLIEASDPNGQTPILSATPLPAGASFTDNGDGTAFFDWVPAIGQAGTYLLTFSASDGALQSSEVATLTVHPDHDRDGDGMDDAWELLHFETLERDGTGDFDGDGITDLQEFIDGTDPTRSPGPGQPEALSPEDDEELVTLQPTLQVSNGVHSDHMTVTYAFEVATDVAMTDVVAWASQIEESVSGITSWVVTPELEDNTPYYWRGRAHDGVTASEWVGGRFRVNLANDVPNPPNISYPLNNAVVASLAPTLEVSNGSDPDNDVLSYHFVIRTEDSATPLAEVSELAEGTDGMTRWQVPVTLEEDRHYLWQVTVNDGLEGEASSELSRFLVSTQNDAPSAPVLVAPTLNAEITHTSVDLIARGAVDPEGSDLAYRFEIDTIDTFDSPAKQVSELISPNGEEATWTVFDLQDDTWYEWRVKANDGEVDSAWTSGRFFVSVENNPPPVPVAVSPDHDGWVGTLSPSFVVAESVDVDGDDVGYLFEVYKLSKRGVFKGLMASGESDTPAWTINAPLPKFGWYAWRAFAVDEHGAMSDAMAPVRFFADDDGVNEAPQLKFAKTWRIKKRRDGAVDYYLRWTDKDPDSSAKIALYYNEDNSTLGGTLIAENISEDADGSRDKYRWRPQTLEPGVYHIYAVIDDGYSRVISHAYAPVVIGDGGGEPWMRFNAPKSRVTVDKSRNKPRRIKIKWKAFAVTPNTKINLYYTDDPQSASGTLIASNLKAKKGRRNKGQYRWRVSNLPIGDYHLYGVIGDGSNAVKIYAPGMIRVRE